MSKLNCGDFQREGFQDCGNVFDTNNHYDAWRKLGKNAWQSCAESSVKAALKDWVEE